MGLLENTKIVVYSNQEGYLNFYFKPFIEWSSKNEGFWLTAPRQLRQSVWDILFDIQKDVIEIAGGEPTQIFVKVNPGYEKYEALYILTVATHIAQAGEFETLYAISGGYRQHLALINTNIIFGANLPDVGVTHIKPWIDTWIEKKSLGELKNESLKIRKFSIDWIDKRDLAVQKVRNRIDKELSWVKQPVIKHNWLNQCDQALAFMRAAKETATFSNQNIQVLAQSAESQIEAFENLLSGGMIVETYQSYCDVLTMIKRIRSEAKQYFDSVNSNKIEEFVDTISTLVS